MGPAEGFLAAPEDFFAGCLEGASSSSESSSEITTALRLLGPMRHRQCRSHWLHAVKVHLGRTKLAIFQPFPDQQLVPHCSLNQRCIHKLFCNAGNVLGMARAAACTTAWAILASTGVLCIV